MLVRGFAHIISFLFHPIFMAVYMLVLLMWINPFLFGASEWWERKDLLVLMMPTSVVIPVLCILLMRPLGFINSLQMKERTERIVPYISTAILYTWLFINIYRQTVFPEAYSIFFLGILMALYVAFFINNFSKISAHTVGAGGLLGMLILTRFYFSYGDVALSLGGDRVIFLSVNTILMLAILIVGLIGTCRLILSAHDRHEIYGGYIVGFSMQLIAFQILS